MLLALGTQASFEAMQRLVGEERGLTCALYPIGGPAVQRAVVFFRGLGINGTNHNHRLQK
jgi:hypothetical protein